MQDKLEYNIYCLGKKIGLDKKEIHTILNDNAVVEPTYFSSGPPFYPGNRYGAISISDLKIQKED